MGNIGNWRNWLSNICNTKTWSPRWRNNLETLERYVPGIAIVAVIVVFVVVWVTSYPSKDENTEHFSNQSLTLPTDSLVGPRVEIQKQPLQVANGGDQTIWIEWVGSSQPFYPEDSTAEGGRAQRVGEQNTSEGRRPKDIAQKGLREAVTAKGGGRIRIDPGQHVFFPVKKTRLEERIRLSPLMGCDEGGSGCQVGAAEGGRVTPYFEFLFSPPKSRTWDSVLISAKTGTTLPFNFSYCSGEENAVTTMICSLPPEECPVEFQALNIDDKFIGCASGDTEGDFKTLLAQNCLVTQSPSHQLVGSSMFEGGDNKHIYLPADHGNRFKLTFYVKGFEWIN